MREDRQSHHKHHYKSAQTFRRGRAIAFLEHLLVKRSTLQQQLQQPEYEAIKQVISGELKAVDAIVQEFKHAFELQEEVMDTTIGNGENTNHDTQ